MINGRTNVCIVGGRAGRNAAALLLARRGVDVLVLEGHRTFEREFRGEVLQPSAAQLLDELGLLLFILEQPHSLLTKGMVRVDARTVATFEFTTIVPEYPYAIWMPQPVFLRALREKAAPFSNFDCWKGSQVTDLVEENGKVVGVTGLRDGKDPFEVRADVVVGADGRFSRVRKLANLPIEYKHHDFDIIWFTVDRPPNWTNTMCVSFGNDVRGLILPKYPHHLQAGIALPTGAWRQWRGEGHGRRGTGAPVRRGVPGVCRWRARFQALR